LYIGGDSGYDKHFAEIGTKFGEFDLVILEAGQYNEYWKYIHMLPHEIVKAAQDLKAKKLMPVHWGKFTLALHAWDEPILKVSEYGLEQKMPLLTPMIGESVDFMQTQTFEAWWKKVD
jgi:L-ascorbate metabolism protein UlaG (beta-lactamase superfamily)